MTRFTEDDLTCDAFSATDFELLKAIASHVALFVRDRLLQEEREQEKAFQEHLKVGKLFYQHVEV